MVFWVSLVLLGFVAMIVVINTARSDSNSLDPNDAMRMTDLWLSRRGAARIGGDTSSLVAPISVLTYMMIIVLGASAVGAEYRAGTVTTVLTWEPRRIRLLTARLAAAAIVGMVFFLVVHAVFIGGWAIGVQLQGRTAGTDTDFWRELVFVVLRGTVLAGVLAVISGALATLGRNTAAAMGIWFGYLIAVEAILRSQIADFVPWFLTPNAAAFYGWESVTQNGHSVSPGAGTLRLALFVVVVAGGALAVFQRRDVT